MVGRDPARTVHDYLQQQQEKQLLRFIVCGSVDDGKSTLIGRLLHDTHHLFDDQLAVLRADSVRSGTRAGDIDYALLLDGLEAEREQGITIDVAYRFFDTDKRKFIVADCPGHEQYTRNMVTGASTAHLAVVLVDARKGVLTQTRRHSYIAALLGIRHVVLAVNKMDLVGYSATVFEKIHEDYLALARNFGIERIDAIPLSALKGSNIAVHSANMPWYRGPHLLEALEAASAGETGVDGPLRMPVQWVNRPDQDFRGLAGTIVSGQACVGDAVIAAPALHASRIARIIAASGDVTRAEAGQAVTLVLAEDVDVGRGQVIAAAGRAPPIADQFAAHLVWMDRRPLLPGRAYWLRIGSAQVSATVTEIKHKIDIDTQAELAAKHLDLNDVAYCNLDLDRAIVFEPYVQNRTLGGFILIDREDNATVACGTIDFALRRSANVQWQRLTVDKIARARIKAQIPCCVWFTGLSGAGKSTIADLVEKRLHARGMHTYLLDGDNIRHGLNKDLGFTDEDRVENIRRVAEVAKLMVDAGLIVLVSFISPFCAERRMARGLFASGEFLEAFVDVPLAIAEMRDAKGLYAKARAGWIPNFTGINSPYETPENAELHLDSAAFDADTLAAKVVDTLLRNT